MIKERILLCTFLFTLLHLNSVVSFSQVKTETDYFTGVKTTSSDFIKPLILDFGKEVDISEMANTEIMLRAERKEDEEGNVNYSLIVGYVGKEWLFIRSGESLLFNISDEYKGQEKCRLKLTSSEGSTNWRNISESGVTEMAIYPTTLEVIEKIANSSIIDMRVYGSTRKIDSIITTAQMTIDGHLVFKEFVSACKELDK